MPVYVMCPDCGADIVIPSIPPATKEGMHDPVFLAEMGKKIKDEKPAECPKCGYEINLLEQTFYWKD